MRILIFGFLCLVCTSLWGQNDKVFLKNGSLIRGIVVEGTITDTILIEIRENLITVPVEIVDEVRLKRRNGVRLEGYEDLSYPKGWSTVLESGILIGSHYENGVPGMKPIVRLSQEYHFHPFLNIGVGAGIFLYDYYDVFPLTLDYHAVLGKSHRSWILYGSLGHGFAYRSSADEEDYEVNGGVFYQVGLGWLQRVGNQYIRLKMGYAVQRIEEEKELSATFIQNRIRRMNRLSLQVAYVFKY